MTHAASSPARAISDDAMPSADAEGAADAAEAGVEPREGDARVDASGAGEPAPVPPRLFLYDGECGLCHRTVKFLLRVDRDRVFSFAPLQGETAARLRARHGEIPEDLGSVVYIEDDTVHLRSRAFVRSARHLPYPWRALSWLWFIPRPLADLAYRFVARVRYRVFGRRESCEIPSPEDRARFLP